MKQHHSIFPPAASLACALILMLAACTSDALDELPPAGTDPDARPLTITVSDGGMYATGQTRAQERGYSTVFTEGDRIGEGRNPGGEKPLPYPTGRQVDAACRHFSAFLLTR